MSITQKKTSHSLFLFAGEQSGDLLGGNLIKALKELSPDLELFGVGGKVMAEAGLEVIHPMERFQVMGFSDVFKSLPRLYADFKKIRTLILNRKPEAVILIDYADFNMRLAASLRKKGYQGKIVHYVCPSVWAWRKNRVFSMAKNLDLLLTILPFEKNCFNQTKLDVTYVGHPLVSVIDNYKYGEPLKTKEPLIAIFPGSRRHEIEINLPLQIKAAKELGLPVAVSVARPELQGLIEKHAGKDALLVPCEKRYELMKSASCALATSGTIILELGLHSVPTVVTYKMSALNCILGKYIFRINLPSYTLVNLICEKKVYPEFIHRFLSTKEIGHSLKKLLEQSEQCQQECANLRSRLTRDNANLKAAQTILDKILI